jgi:hypothetical protein
MQAAVAGKKRCRMHGGAAGSGAPLGNKNRYVHGHYSTSGRALRRLVREMLKTVATLSTGK